MENFKIEGGGVRPFWKNTIKSNNFLLDVYLILADVVSMTDDLEEIGRVLDGWLLSVLQVAKISE